MSERKEDIEEPPAIDARVEVEAVTYRPR